MAQLRHKLISVITGDMVGSTQLDPADRKLMVKAMNNLGDMLTKAGFVLKSQEVFRGDSFQVVMNESSRILDVALLIRAHMRGIELESQAQLDVRLGIGVGQIEFKAKTQNESDGTAFRLAAQALEHATKNNLANIWILTNNAVLDEHLNTINVAWESIISRWTVAQSKSIQWSLQGLVHQEIANKLKVTQPTITRSLQSADDKVIHYLKTYCQKMISTYLETEVKAS